MRSLLCAAAVGEFKPDSDRWTFSTAWVDGWLESWRFSTALVGVQRAVGRTVRVVFVADRELLTPRWWRLVAERVSGLVPSCCWMMDVVNLLCWTPLLLC
jgi:hypothetical protein